MNHPNLPDLGRAPRPIRDLAHFLAERGTPLVEESLSGAPPGDRTLHATTPLGILRVWTNSGFWGVDAALPGVGGFVDAHVWAACRDGRALKRWDQPTPAQAVAWIRELLSATTLPAYDAACLARVAAEREAGRGPVTGSALVWIVVAHLVLITLALWGAAVFDLMVLRLMASLGFVSMLVVLVRSVREERRRRGIHPGSNP